MESYLNKEKPEVRLRAFRAIDDPETCALFVEGHKNVLTSIGVTKVTSSKNEWVDNPGAFVLIVESLDKKKVYGGVRIHVAGGSQPLPIEEATKALDPAITTLVYNYAQQGTGEFCGLWNSREIAGYGVGSIFLSRACVAISTQIGIKSIFALCAPYTVQMGINSGYEIETSIGNNGTFYYPKLDLIATTMILKDPEFLSKAVEEERETIFKLRENLTITRLEELRKKQIEIHYEIQIPNLENWDLKAAIANTSLPSAQVKTQDFDEFDIFS
ncbi:hypothetical protein [Pedobacter glucosidilyticus]|uniref:hypothetical protein n=1 Tax=Pedobacter glucosidilyticus TaxID=1122941 RepID=UPI0026E97F88|nr:hypothetical protein [Pedobacter glucosidilyticus]